MTDIVNEVQDVSTECVDGDHDKCDGSACKCACHDSSYGGVANAEGMVMIGGRAIHADTLKHSNVKAISRVTGVPQNELKKWAAGQGAGLNLPW